MRHINGFGASKCPTHRDNLQIMTCDVEARHFDWKVYSILPTLPRLPLSLAFDRGNIDPRIINYIDRSYLAKGIMPQTTHRLITVYNEIVQVA